MKNLGAKLSFAVTACALIICITAFFFMGKSLAWFSRNDEVMAGAFPVSARVEDLTTSLLSLGVLEIGTDESYTFENETDGAGQRVQRADLPVDDPNGISYSKYKKALVLELSITATKPRATQIYMVADSAAYTLGPDNHFSTCIKVSSGTLNGDGDAVLKTADSTKAFMDMDAMTKSGRLLLYNGTLQAGETKLYFIIEYNDAFLDYINHYIMTAEGVDYFEVEYFHDVTIVIS